VAVRADGSGVWEPVESASIEDADRYTVVWGAGVLADGTLDVSRRLTLLPGEDQEAAPGPLPQRVSTDDAVEDVGEMDDLGDEIDPFIAPEEAP
jgi:hypothetical protein